MRKLSLETVREVSFLIQQNYQFEQGDCILKQGEHLGKILIISKGMIQVRISRQDPFTKKNEDYWMCNLKEGSCINAYNAFDPDKASFFSFFVISKTCHIDFISVSDLEKLKENTMDLSDCLKVLKLRIM